MKNLFKVYLKKVFSDLHSTIVGIIVGALILSVGGIWVFSKNLWILLKTTMLLPTPLWATVILVLLFAVAYIHLKKKSAVPLPTPDLSQYREEFHVYWSENYKMRCLNCGGRLKASTSKDPSIFHCAVKNCDVKHVLKDPEGNKITEQEAIDRMKTLK